MTRWPMMCHFSWKLICVKWIVCNFLACSYQVINEPFSGETTIKLKKNLNINLLHILYHIDPDVYCSRESKTVEIENCCSTIFLMPRLSLA